MSTLTSNGELRKNAALGVAGALLGGSLALLTEVPASAIFAVMFVVLAARTLFVE